MDTNQLQFAYIVFEQGIGTIHAAFTSRQEAQEYADYLSEKLDMDCFVVIKTIFKPIYK